MLSSAFGKGWPCSLSVLLFSKQNPDIDIGSAGGAWAQMECHGSTEPAVALTATASGAGRKRPMRAEPFFLVVLVLPYGVSYGRENCP